MSDEKHDNLDLISGEAGAHPVGTGIGATGGALAGAAAGTLGGPIGSVVGGVAGAVIGGLAGKAGAELVNPTAEEAYWRERYATEPYYEAGRTYDDYGPAYALGWTGVGLYGGEFDAAEPQLARAWEAQRGRSSLAWPHARHATRAAWGRVNENLTDAVVPLDNDDVIAVLNDLLETCRDGEYGFNTCADHTSTAQLKVVFQQRSKDCTAAALELYNHILRLGGTPKDGGTASGAIHRGWAAVRGALSGYSDYAVLDECERGEDTALARYRKALKEALPADIRAVVEGQRQGAQRNHDQIKALRDQYKLGA
ncbi:PA2169 family four-helix-bundle protein [Rhodoferax sp.]|uniref:ferritin-like domain-containing protein n=1 Tax=Rhodoferax sp. TaxID=50421 RepID=UPI00374D0882